MQEAEVSAARPLMPAATAGTNGIVYTCGPQLQAAAPGVCNTLNSTTAGLYSSTFTNAGASIYVELGNTALGESFWRYSTATYTEYRNALASAATDSNDSTALADSVPASNPFPGSAVGIQGPLQRALGLPPAAGLGVESNGSTPCNIGAEGCYDGVITISNREPLYYRIGAIAPNQYDFFTVIEHETDEILGTSSCAVGCGRNLIFPADLFRYHSDGTRSLAAGGNASCAASASGNACFSLDGVHMLQQYNNVNNGDDFGDWVTSCVAPLVQDAEICAGVAGVDPSPAAEILVLDAVAYAARGQISTGPSVTVTSSTPDGAYGVGASISIQILFSQPVTVTGAPQLALNSGGFASFSSGSGTSTLTFLYTVAAGQISSLLDCSSTSALTLNGGSIKAGGSAVNLTLPVPGSAGSLSAGRDIVIDTSLTTITIQTNPEGLSFSVDGNPAQTAPQPVNLAVGSHSISVAANESGPLSLIYTFTGWSDGGAATHNIIVGVSPASYTATFAAMQGIVGGGLSVPPVTVLSANGYFSIFGQNLAGGPFLLKPSDLVNGALPTNLGSTCVKVGSAPAFPTYVSGPQINAIAPSIPASGSQPVTVTVNCGTAKAVTLPAMSMTVAKASPELLYWVQYADGQDPVIAVDGLQTNEYVAAPGLIPGLTFRAAQPGEVLTLYGVAFGPTVSGGPLPGTLPPAADSAPPGYSVTIGNQPADVSYVGVTPGTAGLYQVNVKVPAGLAAGNYPIILNVNGVSTPGGAFLTVGP